MLKLGDKNITKLYYGDKAISKAYLGDKLVFQANKPIFLDYVYFDGNSYIDTGLKHKSCRIETAVKYESGQSRRMLTGWSGAGSYWGMMSNGKLEVSGANATDADLTDYTTLEIVLDNENLLFTVTADNTTKTVAAVYANNTYTIGCTVPSSVNKIIGNVYYHRAYNTDGVLIQDLRPCIDPKGTVCFYDMVTKKYFYNQGTGTLKAGGKFVESIVFDGASWIDIGYMPSSNTRVVSSAIFTQWNDGLANYVFGVYGDNRNFGLNVGSARNFFNIPWGASAGINDQTKGIIPELNVKYSFDVSKDGCYINNVEYLSASRFTATFQATKTMFIGWSNGTSAKQMTGKVTPIQIFESGELVQDLRPYVDADGAACFKDVITGDLFYNKGTGTLGYTE